MTATEAISTPATHAVSRQRTPAGRSARPPLIAGIEAVADRAHGHDRHAPAVAVAKLASQVTDVHVDDVGSRVVVVTPYRAQDLLAREHVSAIAEQIDQQLKLGRGKPYQRAAAAHFAREKVDLQI